MQAQRLNKQVFLNSIVTYDFNSTIDSTRQAKTYYAYDNDGNTVLTSYSFWNQRLNNWIDWQKYEGAYDHSGRLIFMNGAGDRPDGIFGLTLKTTLRWDTLLLNWRNYRQTEYRFDDHGNPVLDASYWFV